MNSSFNPYPNHYQLNLPRCKWFNYEYGGGYSYRSEEEEAEMPEISQANMENVESKEQEVYKDDFVTGFVPDHNHGSVDYTSVNDGHVHQCLDITHPPKRLEDGTHVHYVEGYTLFEDGHHHYYKAWSGPGIPFGNGMHVHYYDFNTTVNDGHSHRIKGVDMPAPGTL